MGHYWFAFDIGAYEDSTAHLTMLQDGAYNRLIRQYYKTSKPIPLDENQIVRVSGAFSEDEIAAVSFVLKEFFVEKPDGWHNKRADAELTKRRYISKVRQIAADVKNRRLRTRRMQDANAIGKHTDDEWQELVRLCGNKCVRCGSDEQVTRDHIVPVYKGGSNHISNIQPLCQSCNSSKGPETKDFRPTAIAEQMQSKLVTENEQLIPQLQLQKQLQSTKSKAKAPSAFSLPDWIPQENWDHFSEMRKRVRKPMTDRAMALIVTELYKLKSRGSDPGLVLDQSVRNSWQDVYEIRRSGHETDGQPTQERKPDKPDLSAQADPDCRACYGGGYEHKEGKLIPCGCTRRTLAGRPDRQPGGSQALGDSRTTEARFAEENPGRIMGKAAIG